MFIFSDYFIESLKSPLVCLVYFTVLTGAWFVDPIRGEYPANPLRHYSVPSYHYPCPDRQLNAAKPLCREYFSLSTLFTQYALRTGLSTVHSSGTLVERGQASGNMVLIQHTHIYIYMKWAVSIDFAFPLIYIGGNPTAADIEPIENEAHNCFTRSRHHRLGSCSASAAGIEPNLLLHLVRIP